MRKVEIPTSQASISTAIYNMGQMSLREALRESFRSFPSIQALHLLTWKRSPSTSFLNTSKPRLHSWLAQAQHTTKASPQTVWPPTLCLYLCNLLYSDGDFPTPTNPAILLLQLQWFLSINNTLLMKTCPEVFKKRVDSHFKHHWSQCWRVCTAGKVLQCFSTSTLLHKARGKLQLPKEVKTAENADFPQTTSSVSTQPTITPNGSNGCLIYRYF